MRGRRVLRDQRASAALRACRLLRALALPVPALPPFEARRRIARRSWAGVGFFIGGIGYGYDEDAFGVKLCEEAGGGGDGAEGGKGGGVFGIHGRARASTEARTCTPRVEGCV